MPYQQELSDFQSDLRLKIVIDLVDGLRLRIWIAAINAPTVYPLGDILYMSVENHGGIMLTGGNSWFVHQSALWKSYKQRHLVANQKELDFVYKVSLSVSCRVL
jgi:hypothetical protein